MPYAKHPLYFLLIFLAAAVLVAFFIIQPFLGPLIIAAVFAFLFQPVYRWMLNMLRGRRSVAAFATMIVAIFLVMPPIIFIGFQIFLESSQLYQTLASSGPDSFLAAIENGVNRARALLPIPVDFKIDFSQYIQQGLDALIQNFGAVFSSFAGMILNFVVFLTSFYFLLKDGNKLKDYYIGLSPLPDRDDEMIVSRLSSAVSSVVKGNLAIALIQGALTGVGFALFGVPNAVLWGSVTAIAALIPGVGTALVIAPAVAFLFITGHSLAGVGLLVWGVTAVGLIDNFLGPKLVGHGMRMHPLLVFLVVLGGMAFFGPLGFLLGPLAMSLCLALIEIYFSLRAADRDSGQAM